MTPRFALAALLLLLAGSVRAGNIADVTAGVTYDSNLPRAQLAHDIMSDVALQAGGSWGRFFTPADGLTVRATLDASGEVYTRFSGMNNVAVGGSASLRRKFGLGAFAPWIGASAGAARLEYVNRMRDGWRFEGGISAGKRLTEAWDIDASFRYQHRTADDEFAVVPGISGDAFDLQARVAALKTEYAVTDKLTLGAGFDYRRGDVVSTTLRNFTIFVNSDAIALDPVFGNDTVAYRLYAVTRAWRLGASHALGASSSINLVAERWISRARAGLDYYNTLVGASYVHVF